VRKVTSYVGINRQSLPGTYLQVNCFRKYTNSIIHEIPLLDLFNVYLLKTQFGTLFETINNKFRKKIKSNFKVIIYIYIHTHFI